MTLGDSFLFNDDLASVTVLLYEGDVGVTTVVPDISSIVYLQTSSNKITYRFGFNIIVTITGVACSPLLTSSHVYREVLGFIIVTSGIGDDH